MVGWCALTSGFEMKPFVSASAPLVDGSFGFILSGRVNHHGSDLSI